MSDELVPQSTLAPARTHDDDVVDMFLARKALRSVRTAEIYSHEVARFRNVVAKPLHEVCSATSWSTWRACVTAGPAPRPHRRFW